MTDPLVEGVPEAGGSAEPIHDASVVEEPVGEAEEGTPDCTDTVSTVSEADE